MDLNTNENNIMNTAGLEAVLFIYGEPILKEKLAKILKIDKETLDEMIKVFVDELSKSNRGMHLIDKGDRVVLATKPEFSVLMEEFVKDDLKEDLTPAAIETLSLVAYFGPITRTQIDYIRGVNSSFILRNLLIRGLVERKPGKGGMFLYETSFDFLKFIGASKVEDLPEFEKYKQMKDSFFEVTEKDASMIIQESENQPAENVTNKVEGVDEINNTEEK